MLRRKGERSTWNAHMDEDQLLTEVVVVVVGLLVEVGEAGEVQEGYLP